MIESNNMKLSFTNFNNNNNNNDNNNNNRIKTLQCLLRHLNLQ